MTSSICGPTQSESITSPQNNDKLQSTNMQTSLKQYPGSNLPQTMRGMMSNSRWIWCWCWGWWWWCCRCDGYAPPYAKEELLVSMAVISLRRQQQIRPSGGVRWILPPPQKIARKLGRPFFLNKELSMRIRRRGNHQAPNGPRWRDLLGWSCHLVLFEPRGSSRVLLPLQSLLVIKY
jgi:hypothetical protein